MNKKYDCLCAIEYSDPWLMGEYGYKYIIPDLNKAFKTDKGFKHFKEIYNLKVKDIEILKCKGCNEYIKKIYFKPITINEPLSFWKKEEIKKGMKHFMGLSSGSYVDCYYKHYRNYVLVMKPNPNAPEVYKPYNYLAMCEEWG